MLNMVIKCTLSKLKPLYMREAFDRLHSVGQGIVEQEQKTHGNNTSEQDYKSQRNRAWLCACCWVRDVQRRMPKVIMSFAIGHK